MSKIEGGVTNTYVRDGAGVTAPVIRDTFASYTPGTSERRGSTTTFLHNGLKNAEMQTDSGKTVSATKQYDAFGNLTTSTGTWQGAFGYAGGFGYQEDSSGLKLLGHRYYDSSTGRFLTRDPKKHGRNWYAYCGNEPISRTDPSGYKYIYGELGIGGAFGIGGSVSISLGIDLETGHIGIGIEAGLGIGLMLPGPGASGGVSPGLQTGVNTSTTVTASIGPAEVEIPLPADGGEVGGGLPGGMEPPPGRVGKLLKVGLMKESKVSATVDVTEAVENKIDKERSDWERSRGDNLLERFWDFFTKPNQDWRRNLDQGLPIFAERTD